MENKESTLPLVSVIVPCYNHEKYIVDCLQSVYECDYKNIELIIIDDGSRDNSFKMAEEWLKKNSSRFINFSIVKQENKGICVTLNTLVNKSKGEYLIPLASDDRLLPNAISGPLENAIKMQKNVIITDAQLIDENGVLISESAFSYLKKSKKLLYYRFFFYLDILLLWEVPYQHYFVKKDFLVKLGMYNENLVFEDLDFVLKSLALNEVSLHLPATWQYRLRRNDRPTPGLSVNDMEKTTIDIFRIHYHKFRGFNFWIVSLLMLRGSNIRMLRILAAIFLKLSRFFLNILHKSFKKNVFFRDHGQ